MARHNLVGSWGEDVAVDHLVSQGYAIVARNERVGHDEIDIIAVSGGDIVFVEVKTRTTPLTDPLEAVTPEKMRRLCRAADRYMRFTGDRHRPRVDIIAVTGSEAEFSVEHFEDAFMPPLVTI